MKPKQLRIIRCPMCGYEYLPGEIFMPNEFLGQPTNVVRDYTGKIIGFDGIKMNDTETYICDDCGCEFTVVATTNFQTYKTFDDNDSYITPLYTDSLFLEET